MNGTALIKKTTKIMYGDAGVSGTAQYMSQLIWILFLKVFDYKEEEWELNDDYEPVIPEPFRFRDWAAPKDIKKRLSGEGLVTFVNDKLFPFLKGETIEYKGKNYTFDSDGNNNKANTVKLFMNETSNYMKDGVKLRQVIDEIADIDFDEYQDRHEFNEFYETFLQELQKGGKATGEFYTPRALTRFITEHVAPKLGEKIADFACGTGGFLVEAITLLQKQVKTAEDTKTIQDSIYGIEWKQLPYMLSLTNMLLHDIDNPKINHGDGLAKNVLDLDKNDYYDCILMNPPFGGDFNKQDLKNFPDDLASAESADMFLVRIIYSLKENGRCGLVLPDSLFISDNNNTKKDSLKRKLLAECNLHTIIRLPSSVFAPYASIPTNLLFFDKSGPTKEIWYYRMDMPEGIKHFNKTHPITIEDMDCVEQWWNNRQEIKDEKEDESMTKTWKSKKYTIKEIEDRNYNLDLCSYPNEEKIVLSPDETIKQYKEYRTSIENTLNKQLENIINLLKGDETLTSANMYNEKKEKFEELNKNFKKEIGQSIIQSALQGELSKQLETDSNVEDYIKLSKSIKNERKEKNLLNNTKTTQEVIDEGLFDIPDTWRWVRFGDIVDFRMGKTPDKTDIKSYGNDYPWVKIGDIENDGTVTSTSVKISEYGFKNTFSEKISPKGTLIMSFKLTIGKVAILDIDALHNEAIISIFPFVEKDNITRDYLFKVLPYISQSGDFKSAIKGKTLNANSLTNLLVPLPPIEEQKRIVEKLDKIMPLVNDLVVQ